MSLSLKVLKESKVLVGTFYYDYKNTLRGSFYKDRTQTYIVIHRLQVWHEGLLRGREQLRPPGIFWEGGQVGQSDSTAEVSQQLNNSCFISTLSGTFWSARTLLWTTYRWKWRWWRRWHSDACTKVYYDTFKINIPWLVPIVIKHNDDNPQCIYEDIPYNCEINCLFQVQIKVA